MFHLFKGGRELKGTFASAEARRERLPVPGAARDRSCGCRRSSKSPTRPRSVYGGDGAVRVRDGADRHRHADARRSSTRPTATSTSAHFGDSLALRGHPLRRPRHGAQPDGVAARPVLCRACAAAAISSVQPPAGELVLGRIRAERADERGGAARQGVGPFAARAPDRRTCPIGAALTYTFDPDWVEHRRQPLRDAQDLRRVRGPHGVGRAVDDPVPRDQRRLAGERSAARRHHDGVRFRHRGRGRRRQGRVRRRDDAGVPERRGSKGTSAASACARGTSCGATAPPTSSSRTATCR